MSQTESESGPPTTTGAVGVTSTPPRASFVRRVLEWYTCRRQRDVARRAAALSERERTFLGRARSALAAGDILEDPSEPWLEPLAGAHAAALYAEALTWVLWSERPDLEQPNVVEAWQTGFRALGSERLPAGDVAEVATLLAAPQLAVILAERTRGEQSAAATLLKRVATGASDARERPQRALDALTLKATARVTLTVLLLVGAISAAIVLRPQKPNLLVGKPWKTSSVMFECHPQQAECGGAKTRIFFHTRDETDPWIQYDLGAKTAFSGLKVENRTDDVGERSVPLAFEVSDDGVHFREIVKRTDVFGTWKASFPTVSAQFIRLRVLRRSILHLEGVALYR